MELTVDGERKQFYSGLGVHAASEIVYDIEGLGYDIFETYLGLDWLGVSPATALNPAVKPGSKSGWDGRTGLHLPHYDTGHRSGNTFV